jgi:hypothetical protein
MDLLFEQIAASVRILRQRRDGASGASLSHHPCNYRFMAESHCGTGIAKPIMM